MEVDIVDSEIAFLAVESWRKLILVCAGGNPIAVLHNNLILREIICKRGIANEVDFPGSCDRNLLVISSRINENRLFQAIVCQCADSSGNIGILAAVGGFLLNHQGICWTRSR